ncbi:MAG: PDZ domain-containing protein [Bacilli bacterium]
MIIKLYEKIKKYLKQNIKLIILMIVLYFIFTIPLSCYIYLPGGIKDISQKVNINDEYKSNGSFNFAYVTEIRGTIPTLLISYLMPNWERVQEEDIKYDNESYEEVSYRNKMFLDEANQNAAYVVYNKLGKKFIINKYHNYVVYIYDKARTDLKIGDEIIEIEGEKLTTQEQYSSLIEKYNIGDTINLKVIEEGKEKDKYIKVINYNDSKITGIYLVTKYDYECNPKINFNFEEDESGPSGGFMLALAIYNKLTPTDITKGYRIVGTGTIDRNGNVGEVGGIEYKLKSAINSKADIFLVANGSNYEEAIKIKEDKNYKIKIIGVSTFDDALRYLENLAT